MQNRGEGLTDERNLLSVQTAQVNRNPNYRLFTYDVVADGLILDHLSQNKVGTRAGGTLQAVGGGAMIAGGAAGCTTGVGCVLGAATIVVGADNLKAGATTAMTGNPTQTAGEQVLTSLGMSPQAASITYSVLGLTPTGVEAALTYRSVNAQAAANAWAKGTYTGQSATDFNGRVYRFSDPNYANTTWDIHPGNIAADHRYSEPEVGSIYSGTSVQTAAAEVGSYRNPNLPLSPKVLVAGDVKIGGVLDLTDPAALQALGVTRSEIVNSSHGLQGTYTQTQRIAEWARSQGYNAILAPSAQASTGTNLITFDSTIVTNVRITKPIK